MYELRNANHRLRNANVSIVSCMNIRNLPLYFARLCALSTPKIANENLQQRTLPGFITIYLYELCSVRCFFIAAEEF